MLASSLILRPGAGGQTLAHDSATDVIHELGKVNRRAGAEFRLQAIDDLAPFQVAAVDQPVGQLSCMISAVV